MAALVDYPLSSDAEETEDAVAPLVDYSLSSDAEENEDAAAPLVAYSLSSVDGGSAEDAAVAAAGAAVSALLNRSLSSVDSVNSLDESLEESSSDMEMASDGEDDDDDENEEEADAEEWAWSPTISELESWAKEEAHAAAGDEVSEDSGIEETYSPTAVDIAHWAEEEQAQAARDQPHLQSSSSSESEQDEERENGEGGMVLRDQLNGFDAQRYYKVEAKDPIIFKGGQVTQQTFKLQFKRKLPCKASPLNNIQRMLQFKAIISHALYSLFHHLNPELVAQIFVENPALENMYRPTRRHRLGNFACDEMLEFLVKAEQSPTGKGDRDRPRVRIEDCIFTLVTYEKKEPVRVGGRRKQQFQQDDHESADLQVLCVADEREEEENLGAKKKKKEQLKDARNGEKKRQKRRRNNATGMKARSEISMLTYIQKSSSYLDPMTPSMRVPDAYQGLCIPMCIVLALKRKELNMRPKAEADPDRGKKSVQFHNYRQSPLMVKQAKDLVMNADLEPLEGPFTTQQIGQIQRYLGADYQINIYSKDGPPDESYGDNRAPFHINLLVREDLLPVPRPGCAHSVLITNMQGFFGKRRRFCSVCKKTYSRESSHRCDLAACRHCKLDYCRNEDNRKIIEPYTHCQDCDRTFFTQGCFIAHKRDQCKSRARCQLCRQVMLRKKLGSHPCGQRRCQHCKLIHLTTEWCFVRPVRNKDSPFHPGNKAKKTAKPLNKRKRKKSSKTKKKKKRKMNWDPKDQKNLELEEEEDMLWEMGLDSPSDEGEEEEEEEEMEGEEGEDEEAEKEKQQEEEEEDHCDSCRPSGSQDSEKVFTMDDLLSRKSIWYADCETFVDPESQEHTANLIVLQRPLYGLEKRRLKMDYEERKYKGPTAMRQFVADGMKEKSEYADSLVIFHNASGFDGHLWHRELLLADSPPVRAIYKGERILTFTTSQNNIKLLDSLQFIPGTALSQFPAMFGLDCGDKLEFPHKLNVPEWVDFNHPEKVYREVDESGVEHRFPMRKYFHIENKSPKALAKFDLEYKAACEKYAMDKNRKYKPVRELKRYCKQDVRILREACEKVRATWLEQFSDMEPFDFVTFPSFNNALYRTKYMTKDSIVLLPPQGFHHSNRRYSVQAMGSLFFV